jgi:hypothetical protein
MATNKDTAHLIYAKHIDLAATDGRLFRKTVMDEIMATCNCTLAASATFYNNSKKVATPVEGLGRPAVAKGVRRPGANKGKADELQDDDECYTVLELLKHKDGMTVGRCRSHLLQGDASEDFDSHVQYKPSAVWILIKGLGPNHGDPFKLSANEEEIKRYTPANEAVVEKDPVLEY